MLTLNRGLTALATLGILGGVVLSILDLQKTPVAPPFSPPAIAPYKNFISGSGLIEAASANIQLGTLIGGVIVKILVKRGQIVEKGTPLLHLDSRQPMAELITAKAQVYRMQVALQQQQASLKLAEDLFALVENVKDKRGVSKEELVTRRDNVAISKKSVAEAQAALETSLAQESQAQTFLDFYTIKAPIDCEILQINKHLGEYVVVNGFNNDPIMLLGDVGRYHIRVDIDENDAWRFNKNEPAMAFLRGNSRYKTPLKFEYVEPYVIPKKSLTGDPTEKVSTRVLQVIYSYDPKSLPAYVGQQIDVYIRSTPIPENVHYVGPLRVSK